MEKNISVYLLYLREAKVKEKGKAIVNKTLVKKEVFCEMDDEAYFSHPAIDQSQLKRWMKSPRAFALSRLNQDEPSPSMRFGTAMHSLVLGKGPRVEESRRGEEKQEGTVYLSSSEYSKCRAMAGFFPEKIFKDGMSEAVMIAKDPATGLTLKGKADFLPYSLDSDGIYRIRDYKTTNKERQAFSKSIFDPSLRYDIQAVFYMKLFRLCTGYLGPLGFQFVVQEKNEPYSVGLWDVDEKNDWVKKSKAAMELALRSLASFKKEHGKTWEEDALNTDPIFEFDVFPEAWQSRELYSEAL